MRAQGWFPPAGIIQRMLIAVAVNPRASFGRARHAGKDAAAHFRAAGAEVLLLCADSYAGLAQAVEDALEQGVDALVVVGGDGMVHLGLNAIAGAGAGAGRPAVGFRWASFPPGRATTRPGRWACRCTTSRRPANGRWSR